MNINGTYTSENGDFVLTITNSDEARSTFEGTYVAQYTPQGTQQFEVVGRWYYVNHPGGELTPLNLGFIAVVRPPDRPFCILDSWAGVMIRPEALKMIGGRTYLPAGGPYEVSSLGTHSFA